MDKKPIKITSVVIRFDKAVIMDIKKKDKLSRRIQKYIEDHHLPGIIQVCFSFEEIEPVEKK